MKRKCRAGSKSAIDGSINDVLSEMSSELSALGKQSCLYAADAAGKLIFSIYSLEKGEGKALKFNVDEEIDIHFLQATAQFAAVASMKRGGNIAINKLFPKTNAPTLWAGGFTITLVSGEQETPVAIGLCVCNAKAEEIMELMKKHFPPAK